MGTHPIFESDFDCLTENKWHEKKRIEWERVCEGMLLRNPSRMLLEMNSETKQLFRLVLWSKLPTNLLSSSEKLQFAKNSQNLTRKMSSACLTRILASFVTFL